MRPPVFSADVLRRFLRKNHIATLPQLKPMLGTEADITVFRKLKELSFRTSYSHRGAFYTLDEIARFDEQGLWSFESDAGSPVRVPWWPPRRTPSTQGHAGYFASELEDLLHVPVKEPLLQLVAQGRVSRQTVSGLYLYCAANSRKREQQLRARQALLDQAAASAGSLPGNVSDELRAAIVLFASLLDEQQRRLYAGLESLQLGSDRQIAELLGLDPHTVAKGRRQLLAQDVETDRVRAVGGGRKPVEKKRPR